MFFLRPVKVNAELLKQKFKQRARFSPLVRALGF